MELEMLETMHSEIHDTTKAGVKTVRTVQDFQRVREYNIIETKSSAPLSKGDHVLALPYWSEISMLNKTDSPAFLEGLYGLIYDQPSGRRDATIYDWPWLSSTIKQNSRVVKADWYFNATSFVDHPTLSLPKGSVSEWDALTRLADTKALGNVRKALANLPMILAERRETLKMIGGKALDIAKGARALQSKSLKEYRRTKPKNRRAVAERISNEHLEFVFGWLPVIGEIEGIAEFVQRDRLDFIRSRGVQVQRTETQIVSSTPLNSLSSASYFGTGSWGWMESKGTETNMLGVRTALRYRLSSALVGELYALGFDPVGTGFDLVPLSFVSGWISNFDYWIRTITPEFGLEFETGSRNRRTFHGFQVEGRHAKNPSRSCYGVVSPVFVDGMKRLDVREVLEEAPEASLEWDVEVGLFEVTAGISLALQRFYKPLKLDIKQKAFRYKGPRPKWLPEIRYTGRR